MGILQHDTSCLISIPYPWIFDNIPFNPCKIRVDDLLSHINCL